VGPLALIEVDMIDNMENEVRPERRSDHPLLRSLAISKT
jgi:hypothetical protein